jgi:hypothetical protein
MARAEANNTPAASGTAALTNRSWVTRQGVYVDCVASASLIRRFIDPRARVRLVRAKDYVPQPGALRFNMFEAPDCWVPVLRFRSFNQHPDNREHSP